MRLWSRPPHDHCERCAKYHKYRHRLFELEPAVLSYPNDPGYAKHHALLAAAGGREKAWEEKRNIDQKIEELQKHVDWRANQRGYCTHREKNMKEYEALLQLDYYTAVSQTAQTTRSACGASRPWRHAVWKHQSISTFSLILTTRK